MQLSPNRMFQAFLTSTTSFEGIFWVGVKTTGIFCRPSCHARKPKKQNVEFFHSIETAVKAGYRACKLCRPIERLGKTPTWVIRALKLGRASPRLSDPEYKKTGIDPQRLRRWFRQNHRMTFHAYLRSQRAAQAVDQLAQGKSVVDVAFDSGYESLSGFGSAIQKTTGRSPTKNKNTVHVCRILTPLGPMIAGATERGICLLEFSDQKTLSREIKKIQTHFNAPLLQSPHLLLKTLRIELREYFSGSRTRFTLPLDLFGSNFQKQSWQALLEIPYGETRSYQEQAKRMKNPRAIRAVASANARNRIAILIPCHRVIGSDGELRGYAGGLWRKKFLLNLEQTIISQGLGKNHRLG